MKCKICNSYINNTLFNISNFNYIECSDCGVISTNPIPSNKEIAEHYRTLSLQNSNYDLRNIEVRTGVQRQIFEYVGGRQLSFKKVIDIGCLDGLLLDLFKAEGAETYGIELQDIASKVARSKGHTIVNSMFEEAIEEGLDRNFDLVIAAGIIEHVVDPVKFIKFCSSITKPGGTLLIQTPNTSSMLARLMGKRWFCYSPIEHIYHFNINNITKLLNDNSFKVKKTKAHFKKLKINYIYHMMNFFGKDIHKIIEKFWGAIPKFIQNMSITAYGGEMLLVAEKEN
jgi:2-polyprenyl-3-methyl-5-hydroxy-6-metoxy-1,4-benzoquinol methylase